MKQVITVSPDGSLSGLDRKNKGVDLRQFGRARIERVSEIKWNEKRQAWYVEIIAGPLKGHEVTTADCFRASGYESTIEDVALFDSYDMAVIAEVAFLDYKRKAGLF